MKKINVLELFGGIGSIRFAYKRLKIEANYEYVENDKRIVEMYNALHNTNMIPCDIYNWKWDGKTKYDLLIAGFPCQPFSKAGKNLGVNDPRGTLYQRTLEIIAETKPKNIILENVLNITKPPHNLVLKEIKEKLLKLNYTVDTQILNALDFGSRQSRIRVFVIAKKIPNLTNIDKKMDFVAVNCITDWMSES